MNVPPQPLFFQESAAAAALLTFTDPISLVVQGSSGNKARCPAGISGIVYGLCSDQGLGLRPGIQLGSAALFTIPVLTKGLKLPEEAEEVLPLYPSHPALSGPHHGGGKELIGPRGFQMRGTVPEEAWARKGPLCPRL